MFNILYVHVHTTESIIHVSLYLEKNPQLNHNKNNKTPTYFPDINLYL